MDTLGFVRVGTDTSPRGSRLLSIGSSVADELPSGRRSSRADELPSFQSPVNRRPHCPRRRRRSRGPRDRGVQLGGPLAALRPDSYECSLACLMYDVLRRGVYQCECIPTHSLKAPSMTSLSVGCVCVVKARSLTVVPAALAFAHSWMRSAACSPVWNGHGRDAAAALMRPHRRRRGGIAASRRRHRRDLEVRKRSETDAESAPKSVKNSISVSVFCAEQTLS